MNENNDEIFKLFKLFKLFKIFKLFEENEKIKNKMIESGKKYSKKELHNFINNEIIPIAREQNLNLKFEDFANYIKILNNKKKLDELDEEDLEDIAGGVSLKALALLGAIGVVGTPVLMKNVESNSIKASAWALEEHKDFTAQGFENLPSDWLGANETESQVAKKSLEYGGVFNDLGTNSKTNFVLKYLTHVDEFVNQSHHGEMQFLHCMRSKNDRTSSEVKEKIKTYIEFILEMNKNLNSNRHKFIVDIVKNNEKYEKIFPEKLLKDSKYKTKTLENFYLGENKDLNLKYVMLGSFCHVIEDSFAKSHAQRFNVEENQDIFNRSASLLTDLSLEAKENLIKKFSPITIFGDYGEQDESFHEKADFAQGTIQGKVFRKYENNKMKIKETDNASQSLLAVNTFLQKVLTTNTASEQGKRDIVDLVDKIFNIDENVLNMENSEYENIGIFEGINFDLLNDENKDFISTTKSGKQYQKLKWQNKNSFFDQYNKNLEKERGTKLINVENTLDRLLEETQQLKTALLRAKDKNVVLLKNVSQHATEMLLNLDKINTQNITESHNTKKQNCANILRRIINECLRLSS